ncbi:hypothetical protein [Bradyrhizobium sp. NAS96.2]|uniref:hypothetical protein n=1 Tax=Bradyrhizobium sp. NAS96.2 TaxID=1680160 RepID=UPI00093B039E|nr:hypothetical protein [Bradyrhizobium sp. NAS96.2]OKO84225.1 hypothetical protein AC628_00500 [Bradyrhizobium sp. NAS96.2]
MTTLGQLIDLYLADPNSGFSNLSYRVRESSRRYLRRIKAEKGVCPIGEINSPMLAYWNQMWGRDGKNATARALKWQLKSLFEYGATSRLDAKCIELLEAIKYVHNETVAPRIAKISIEQVNAIIRKAHEWGSHSIALAQALQFETPLTQRDCLGEYVPLEERGSTNVVWKGMKWLHGLRWTEVGDDLVLRRKELEFDLKDAPLTLAELDNWRDFRRGDTPVVICEGTAMPWIASEFRRKWRRIANAAEVPASLRNMDS